MMMMAQDPVGLLSTTTAVCVLEWWVGGPALVAPVKDMPVSMGAEIPEGSKAGNVRKVKSRENHTTGLFCGCLHCKGSSLCLFTPLLSHNMIRSQNGFHCVPHTLYFPVLTTVDHCWYFYLCLTRPHDSTKGKKACRVTSPQKQHVLSFIDEKRSQLLAELHGLSRFAVESTAGMCSNTNNAYVYCPWMLHFLRTNT